MPQHVVAYSEVNSSEERKPRRAPQSSSRQESDTIENVGRGTRSKGDKLRRSEPRKEKKRTRDKESETAQEGKKREDKELRLPPFVLAAGKLHPKPVARFSDEYQGSVDIHSLSPSLDGETLLTASDLKLNLWNIQNPESPLSVLDFSCSSFYIADLSGKVVSLASLIIKS
jgi:hypothetical protein